MENVKKSEEEKNCNKHCFAHLLKIHTIQIGTLTEHFKRDNGRKLFCGALAGKKK